jgi:hypothetical protein
VLEIPDNQRLYKLLFSRRKTSPGNATFPRRGNSRNSKNRAARRLTFRRKLSARTNACSSAAAAEEERLVRPDASVEVIRLKKYVCARLVLITAFSGDVVNCLTSHARNLANNAVCTEAYTAGAPVYFCNALHTEVGTAQVTAETCAVKTRSFVTASRRAQRRFFQMLRAGVYLTSRRSSRAERFTIKRCFTGAGRPVLPPMRVNVHLFSVRGVVPRRGRG